jgi:hypothetical protein
MAVVGWATVVSAPYADPQEKGPEAVRGRPESHRRDAAAGDVKRRSKQIEFSASSPSCGQGRLTSVSPVTAPQWNKLLKLAGAADSAFRFLGELAGPIFRRAPTRYRRRFPRRIAARPTAFKNLPGPPERGLDLHLPLLGLRPFLSFRQ